MSLLPIRETESADIDPRLETALCHAIAIGAVLVLLVPAARGMHATIGWLPLWLLAMPVSAWWALHRFALPLASAAAPLRRHATVPGVAARHCRARRDRDARTGGSAAGTWAARHDFGHGEAAGAPC